MKDQSNLHLHLHLHQAIAISAYESAKATSELENTSVGLDPNFRVAEKPLDDCRDLGCPVWVRHWVFEKRKNRKSERKPSHRDHHLVKGKARKGTPGRNGLF